nr:MAG: hypothetical protein 1 [Jiangsu sediment cysto-like virus 9]
MQLFLIPSNGDIEDLKKTTDRVGVRIVTPRTLRELIVESTSGDSVLVAAVTERQLSMMSRFPAELFDELPAVLLSAPGLFYDGAWMQMATAFPAEDYLQFARKAEKSGHVSFTVEDMEKKGFGDETSLPHAFDSESLAAQEHPGDDTDFPD